jgi:hypothetical protein
VAGLDARACVGRSGVSSRVRRAAARVVPRLPRAADVRGRALERRRLCHVRDGEILAAEPSAAGMNAHPVRRAPELATPEHCGQCHQFAFRDDGMHDPEEALQNTLGEFYGSDASRRGKTCQSCHMTAGSHAFPGIHDPQMLARAVNVEVLARRTGSGIEVDVALRGADIGHAFPTGDVFRRAVLRVRTSSAEDELELQRWLARTTDPDGEDLHVRTVDDTRVPARGLLQETLQLPDDGATSVTWDLVLHRVPPTRAKEAGLDADVVTRLVAQGEATVEK